MKSEKDKHAPCRLVA